MAEGPRIVIAGWAGAGNAGDELLTAWAVAAVSEAGGTPIVLSVDPADTSRRHRVESVQAMSPAALRLISGADGLLVGPGGILQDHSSLWSLPAHCLRPAVANLRKIPVVGAGLGVGPLNRRGSDLMIRRALGRARRVVVRDRVSAELLDAAGVESDVAPDAMFAVARRGAGRVAGVEPDRIVVSLRNLAVAGRFRIAKSLETTPDIEGWALALGALRREMGVQLRFVAFDPGRDGSVHLRIAAIIGDCETVAVDETSAEAEMARALVAVCGRYHAAVLAAACARPVVTLGRGAKLPALNSILGKGSASVEPVITERGLGASVDEAMAGVVALPSTVERLATEAQAHTDAVALLVDSAR